MSTAGVERHLSTVWPVTTYDHIFVDMYRSVSDALESSGDRKRILEPGFMPVRDAF